MPRNTTPKTEIDSLDNDSIKDRPAATLLRSWGKKMSQGQVSAIPVFIGGSWSLAVPRGNKRILQLSVDQKKAKSKIN